MAEFTTPVLPMFDSWPNKKRSDVMGFSKQHFSCERDDLTLRGTLFLPSGEAGATSKKLPAAILSHGFMANQRMMFGYGKALASSGRAAFCFDFAGGSVLGGKSDGKTTDMSVLTEATDLAAVLNHVRSLPFVDCDDILLMGCSQGGLVSALVAAEHPGKVAKLVLFYPALCIPDDARAGKMMFARFDPRHVPERFWCGPMRLGRRYAEDVMAMDPFREIEGYDGPVLIVHGSADRVVNVSYARQALEAYRNRPRARGEARLVILDGAGHGFRGRRNAEATELLLDMSQGSKMAEEGHG